jgi:hypothetical protein
VILMYLPIRQNWCLRRRHVIWGDEKVLRAGLKETEKSSDEPVGRGGGTYGAEYFIGNIFL